MIVYYEILQDGTIGRSTNSPKVAEKYGFTLSTEKEIVYGWDNKRYLEDEVPPKPAPTQEEQEALRANAYRLEVDPITCHINRLKDEEQTQEIQEQIAELQTKRDEKMVEIKTRYPYFSES